VTKNKYSQLAQQIQRHWPRIIISTIITIFFLLNASYVTQWHFIKQIENAAYDMRLRATMPRGQDSRIVIIDIDEKSLAEEGRWPWPRDRMAHLVDLLFDEHNISLLAMDVVWAEPDESSGLDTLEQLANNQLANDEKYLSVLNTIRPSLMHDNIFARYRLCWVIISILKQKLAQRISRVNYPNLYLLTQIMLVTHLI
jgi:adenylate cyclase